MRFSLNFVQEFLKIDIPPKKLASLLTMAGMEVERSQRIRGDWLFDIEVTTNRYDWLSIFGIAKEVAAVLGKKLKSKYPSIIKTPLLKERDIIIEDIGDCPYYIGRMIKGLKTNTSHQWLKERILNCGVSSVDTIVDCTNYCMLRWGNPLHAFDNDKIEGNIYIRRARRGESFVGIDGRERDLQKDNLVIADSKKVIALAGIMGAKNTEVDKNTKNVFLEGAIFSPIAVRRSRRAVGLDTESSYRFERMVSSVYLEYASYEAAKLIEKLAKGTLGGYRAAGRRPKEVRKKITISFSQLDAYLGISFPKAKVREILTNLDFGIQSSSKEKISVLSPRERFDIKREIDVYEEVARIYGYDKILPQIPFLTSHQKKNSLVSSKENIYQLKNQLRTYVALFGFKEIITYSLESQDELKEIGDKDTINVVNPLRKQEDALRNTLLLGMIGSIRHNLNRNQNFLRFFEIADIYFKNAKGFSEILVLSLGVSGDFENFFYLKRAIEKLLNYLNIGAFEFKEEGVGNFTNALVIVAGNREVGFLGKLDQKRKETFDLREDIFFAQLDLSLLEDRREEKKYKSFSPYPAVWRDISICLRGEVKFKEVEKIIRQESGYLVDLHIVDIYKGKDVSPGTSVFTLRIFYQSSDRTLTSQEVDSFHGRIRDRLSCQEGISLR